MPRKAPHSPTVIMQHYKLPPKKEQPVFIEIEKGLHNCDALIEENQNRASQGESEIFVFQDEDNCRWNIRVGLEFLQVNFCPWCKEKLC